jgi:amino acid adenylation domain-containing protein
MPAGRMWPDGPLARAVAAAWAEAFGSAEPGYDDDFFAWGGHSLLAFRLVAALRARTGVGIAADDIFQARTAGRLADRMAAPPAAAPDDISTGGAAVLSSAQRRMWFVEQFAPGTPAHNVTFAVRLRGRLDVAALGEALTVVARHQEVLRWRIRNCGGVPEVTVDPPAQVVLPIEDLHAGGRALARVLRAEAGKPFDLAAGPLWRVRLLRLGERDHVFAVAVHHIIFDGWSQDVLCRDLSEAYQRVLSGGPAVAARIPVTFADYVCDLARKQSAVGQSNLDWWAAHLAGVPPVLDLPRDRPRPASQTFRGASCQARIPAAVIRRLREFCATHGATRNAVLLTVFGILLQRLTCQNDLVVGAPFADRARACFEPLAGLLLQVLPLRLGICQDADFTDHVHRSQTELRDAVTHADAPWERVIEMASGPRDLSRGPLIQVLFNAHDLAEPRLCLPEIQDVPLAPQTPGSLFDLTLHVTEAGGRPILRTVYNPDLYDGPRIRALLGSYLRLADDLLKQPTQPVGRAAMRPRGNRLPHWRDPLPSWDGPGLIQRVDSVVAQRPDTPAVTAANRVLRYRDVAAIAAQTAASVTAAGATPGDAVAVLAARHPALPAILLGVLRAGARWAIIDPSYPPAVVRRQASMLGARVVISFSTESRNELPEPSRLIDASALVGRALDGAGAGAPGQDPAATAPALPRGYLSFTSGTTGTARLINTGVRPLDHFLAWYPARFGLNAQDRFAMLAGLGHDPLLRDLFTPLVLGARLCVPEPDCLRDPAMLAAWLHTEDITVAHLTPQLARLLMTAAAAGSRTLPSLRLVALAGDQATAADVIGLGRLAPRARLVNLYGTTETPQAQAYRELARASNPRPDEPELRHHHLLPVGAGIDGAQLLVLDAAGEPAAVGELGDVIIRSRYLADGYTDPDLTLRYFADTPGGDTADRFFRTGDLGRYLPDGGVVLAGRSDSQAKVRGFRVELGEISAVLAEYPGIRQAHVTTVGSAGERQLRAYAVPADPGIHPEQLREHLRAHLPGHAVPAEVALLPALPLTPNGKVDVTALPQPGQHPRALPGQEDLSGKTERSIAAAWREVLGRPRLGATDNFFDIGGDSLTIVAVQARLEDLLGVAVPVADMFRYPTIRSLASLIDGGHDDSPFGRATQRAAQRRVRMHRRGRKQLNRGGQP